MRVLTRHQQVALQALELLNRSSQANNDEVSPRILDWFRAMGITLDQGGTLFAGLESNYRLDQDQLRKVAELECLPTPGEWLMEPFDHPLQYAAPGLFVAFIMHNGRYIITSVVELRMSKHSAPLIGIEGMGKGWYDLDGNRRTKEGLPFQGSAYAGQIVPVSDEILDLIERQELLSEITGYHRAPFREGGTLHAASTQTLRMVSDLLRRQAHLTADNAQGEAPASSDGQ